MPYKDPLKREEAKRKYQQEKGRQRMSDRYYANREQILAAQKEKYHSDPEHRAKKLEACRNYGKNKRSMAQCCYSSAKGRARRDGIEFTITLEDLIVPEFCPILGIKLERGDGKIVASSPSVDRIDNNKGYVPGNIRVISFRANAMKQDASDIELHLFAEWIKKEVFLDGNS